MSCRALVLANNIPRVGRTIPIFGFILMQLELILAAY